MIPTRRDALFLFALALAVNSAVALFIRTPGYMDAAYYFAGGMRLVRGFGLSEPYLWNYLSGIDRLPVPGSLYWPPLTSFLAAGGMALLGKSFRAAQMPFVLLASFLPFLSYQISRRLGSDRNASFIAGLLTVFSGFYLVAWSTTESFVIFAAVGVLAFLSFSRGLENETIRWFFLAGLFAGAAHLTRADGVLLLLVMFIGVFSQRKSNTSLRAGALIAGYLLVMSPWILRNMAVFGSPLAPGGVRTLWLRDYNDLFLYPATDITLERYLAQGWGEILSGKLWAFGQNLQTLFFVQGMIFLAPFSLIGYWQLRRRILVLSVLIYAVLLFIVMTFVFTFPGTRGGLFHSGAVLLPFFIATGVRGLDRVVESAAARRSSWQFEQAQKVFRAGAVGLAVLLSALIFNMRLLNGGWSFYDDLFLEIGEQLPPDSVIASINRIIRRDCTRQPALQESSFPPAMKTCCEPS